jgi:hypothetical protein
MKGREGMLFVIRALVPHGSRHAEVLPSFGILRVIIAATLTKAASCKMMVPNITDWLHPHFIKLHVAAGDACEIYNLLLSR